MGHLRIIKSKELLNSYKIHKIQIPVLIHMDSSHKQIQIWIILDHPLLASRSREIKASPRANLRTKLEQLTLVYHMRIIIRDKPIKVQNLFFLTSKRNWLRPIAMLSITLRMPDLQTIRTSRRCPLRPKIALLKLEAAESTRWGRAQEQGTSLKRQLINKSPKKLHRGHHNLNHLEAQTIKKLRKHNSHLKKVLSLSQNRKTNW
jgi:hypothetical protein